MDTAFSLILVTVDCLRADHVGFMGCERPTTPFLDSLATESFALDNAIVAGAPTYYSFPAILASRHPLALGRDIVGLAPDEPTLASVLRDSGYRTAAFNAGNPYLTHRFGYDTGFETFRDFLDAELAAASDRSDRRSDRNLRGRVNRTLAALAHRLGPVGGLYDELYFQYCQRLAVPPVESLDTLRRFPAADVIVDEAKNWLEGVGRSPFFLWLHFMDPHAPYYPQGWALERMGRSLSASRARYLNSYWNRGDIGAHRLRQHRDEVMALYDAGIRWMDAQLSRLKESLRHLHLWDRCALAVTADHGEEFLDHGGRFHTPSKVTEELIRVPLLLRVPGLHQTAPPTAPFSLLHLAPTLLDIVGSQVPGEFRGRSFWSRLRKGENWDEPAIVENVVGCTNPFRPGDRLGGRILAVRGERHKLVVDFASCKEELFDLQADPGEYKPLPQDAEKTVRRRLLELARQHLSRSLQSRDPGLRLGARLHELRRGWTKSAGRTQVGVDTRHLDRTKRWTEKPKG